MLEGKIQRQGFLDIIQLLTMSRKTGRLDIKGDAEGELFFSGGELLDCCMGKLVGDDAFIELFILVSGSFKFHEEEIETNRRITKSLTDLLTDASKQAANWDKAREDLPFEDAALVLAPVDPDAGNQFNLDALHWAIISQVNGRRSFTEVARLLGQPLTQVAISIAQMKNKGLITTEDKESALLRTVFRKTGEVLYHLIETRVKARIRDRVFTDFNKWAFSKGFDIRLLENEGVVNNIPYDMPFDEKRMAYQKAIEQMYDAAQSGLNQNELRDHMSELFERLSEAERKVVAGGGLGKFLAGREKEAGDFWVNASDDMGSGGMVPGA